MKIINLANEINLFKVNGFIEITTQGKINLKNILDSPFAFKKGYFFR